MSSYRDCPKCGKPHPSELNLSMITITNKCNCCGKVVCGDESIYAKTPQVSFVGDPLYGFFYCPKCEGDLDSFLACRDKAALETIPDDLVDFFKNFIVIGKELKVKRSSGEVEDGWKIAGFLFSPEKERLLIFVRKGGLEKDQLLKELADVN